MAMPTPDSPIEIATKEVASARKRVEVAESVLKREQSALKAAEKKLADAQAASVPASDKKTSLGLGSLYGTTREERREQMEMTELAQMAEPAAWSSYSLINELRSLQVRPRATAAAAATSRDPPRGSVCARVNGRRVV